MTPLTPMTEIADPFFKKLEAGQGWDACKKYRTAGMLDWP